MKTKKALAKEKKYDEKVDLRNLLPLKIVRAASQLRPRLIIVENVPAMSTQIVSYDGVEERIVTALKRELEETGYNVSDPFVLEASNLGISQIRKRTFLVASLYSNIQASEIQTIQDQVSKGNAKPSLKSTIGDLVNTPTVSPKMYRESVFPDHVARKPNDDDLQIIKNLKQGENYYSLLDRFPQVVYARKHKVYKTSSFRDKFYRLKWEGPSKTIVAHLQKDGNSFIHPLLDRSISVREAARIQSFRDSFVFDVPMVPAFRLIGNAVPPIMGKFLIETTARIDGLLNERYSSNSQFASFVV